MLDQPNAAPAPAPEALSALARANDAFRAALGDTPAYPGKLVLTAGVAAMPVGFTFAILKTIRDAAAFPPEDDPNGEHDFGALEHNGVKVFWKIDYYADADCAWGAEDPEAACFRVLTVMLADECAPGKLARSSGVEDLTPPYRAGYG